MADFSIFLNELTDELRKDEIKSHLAEFVELIGQSKIKI